MIRWSANLAYAIGLITTDGCLSNDGRHIDLTSKDLDQLEAFKKILKLSNMIGRKYAGSDRSRYYYRIEFGNVKLYRFLLKIGLTPHKSKTIRSLKIPEIYFIDFLRGCLDGDGYTYSYWDARWKSSFMLYTGFASASMEFLLWLNQEIQKILGYGGKIKGTPRCYQLVFAKKASLELLEKIYYKPNLVYLKRKRFKIEQALAIIRKQAGVL